MSSTATNDSYKTAAEFLTPTLSTSTTLSALAPLDLALHTPLNDPLPPNLREQLTKTYNEITNWTSNLAKQKQMTPPHELSAQALVWKSFEWCRVIYHSRELCERELMKWEILFDEQVLKCVWRGSESEMEMIQKEIDGKKEGLKGREEKSVDEFAIEKAKEVKGADEYEMWMGLMAKGADE